MPQKVKLGEKPDLKKDFTIPSFGTWEKKVKSDLKGESFDSSLITKTYEGINLQPIYISNDIKNLQQINNFPGFEHFLRGNKASGYIGQDWEIAQEYNQALPEDMNEALKNDLEKGLNSINIFLDYPTMQGLDADHSKVGEVGKGGLSISGVKKMHVLFKNIDLRERPVNINCGFSSLPFTALFKAYADDLRISLMNIKGSIISDPYDYLISFGKLPISLTQIFDEIALTTELMIKSNSPIKTIGVSGFAYNNAGASAIQELAFTLATGAEYLNKLTDRRLKINEIAKRLKFTFGIGSFYFMEISKLRAARILWSKILEAYEASEENRRMFIHAKTTGINQSYFDPYVNMLRTTTEAFSAIVGGSNSLNTNPFDESFNQSNDFTRRIARNTQIILKEESHLDHVIDPAGGSFFVEKLTDDIAKAAWQLFVQIDEMGGMLKAIQSGFVRDEIDKVADEKKKDFAKRKTVLVGTNKYSNPKEKRIEVKPIDYDSIYIQRVDYTKKYKMNNDGEERNEIFKQLEENSKTVSYELIENAIDAYLDGATIGEVSKIIRSSSDRGITIESFKQFRLAETFEELRIASDDYKKQTGNKPKVFLVNMGTLKQFKARADFSRSFFEVGGFEIVYPKGFSNTSDAIKAAIDSKAQAAVICSTDDAYPELVPQLVTGIKEKLNDVVVILAGYPKDQIEEYKKSGIDDFIYPGVNLYQVLSNLLKNIGLI
jgi:methylmalonyl-CoA mutase